MGMCLEDTSRVYMLPLPDLLRDPAIGVSWEGFTCLDPDHGSYPPKPFNGRLDKKSNPLPSDLVREQKMAPSSSLSIPRLF